MLNFEENKGKKKQEKKQEDEWTHRTPTTHMARLLWRLD
jgi:hypothetical protein